VGRQWKYACGSLEDDVLLHLQRHVFYFFEADDNIGYQPLLTIIPLHQVVKKKKSQMSQEN
jgi:hypothetical protein